MNLSREKIINRAFGELGENNASYNNNITDRREQAEISLDNIIRNIGTDTKMLFNATSINAHLQATDASIFNENRFTLPVDYLGMVKIHVEARLEGKYIYSSESEVPITYCRDLPLSEFPRYMEDYMVYSLAFELSKLYTAYEDRVGVMTQQMGVARRKIENSEGLAFPLSY